MNILVIAPNIGGNSPGIVYEKILVGLSKYHNIDIITTNYSPSVFSDSNNISVVKRKKIHPKIEKLCISLIGRNVIDYIWSRKVISGLKKNMQGQYDIVYSLMSFHNYHSLVLGYALSNKFGAKFLIHSVDAIPAPLGWSQNDLYFYRVKKLMHYYLRRCDCFFSSNEEMLKYQMQNYSYKKPHYSDYIYNPSYDNTLNIPLKREDEPYIFLYTGSLYGKRTPKYLFKAFQMLLSKYPNSRLEFVGTSILSEEIDSLDSNTISKIHFSPFCKDLTSFYERAIALIDIDADLKNDIYLSGKIVDYIKVNRIIICETGLESPSRKIFKNISSIRQSNHDEFEILNAMLYAIENYKMADFNDRKEVIKIFEIDTVMKKINSVINKLL